MNTTIHSHRGFLPVITTLLAVSFGAATLIAQSAGLSINEQGYFEMPGLNVTVFSDIYPEGHQTGVSLIQHGWRVAANGDLRLEPSPGQWSPVPRGGSQTIDRENLTITQRLWYPDSTKDRRGFNPIIYPDLQLAYEVSVTAIEENAFRIRVDLDEPLPDEWVGRVGFNFELFPGHLFGKSYLMDDQVGHFTSQPNGPIDNYYGEQLAEPLAEGRQLVVAPGDDSQRLIIETRTEELELWDGRANHNNGWYIVRSRVPAGATRGAVEWIIRPHIMEDWFYEPVVQVSQLGYHPAQPKRVVIEQDKRDREAGELTVYRLTEQGKVAVKSGKPAAWGNFLRYHYLTYDFTDITEPGMYAIGYRSQISHPFQISQTVFERGAWQPTIEYFLPVQMCHMRINEKYRVWHAACHLDDALMAPVDTNHFDGYVQGPATLTGYAPYQPVPQLDRGGWHDAGDYDLRVESQIGTVWRLAMIIEEFNLDYDATLIDQQKRLVELHVPDGRSDLIQQIEHGLLTVLGGYRALGRLYRGIICSDLRQYVMLGDASAMTDNQVSNGDGPRDDRWVFTEENPDRALNVAAGLAAAARVLRTDNPELAEECLTTALRLWDEENENARRSGSRIAALSELILTTGDRTLIESFIGLQEEIVQSIDRNGWLVGRVIDKIPDEAFKKAVSAAVGEYMAEVKADSKTDSPYGVPYTPNIWGAGWSIQRLGVEQYFFYKAWPEHGSEDLFINALNFVLGVHPGENTASFASGIGSSSALVAYGVNRADWSYIPGGVASGTALIRPDLPEFKVWPFFWQQTEYVMGGGATNYMFLALAAEHLYGQE